MDKYGVVLAMFNDEQRQLEVDEGIICEHLSLHQTEYVTNKDGRKVCDECCDHSGNAGADVYQWNGLTYCWVCCPHRFTGKDFVEDLDGVPTCTMCWVIVPNGCVRMPEYNLGESLHLAPRLTKNTRRTKDTGNEGGEAELDITTVTVKALKGLAKEYGVKGYSKYTAKTRGELERLVNEAKNDETKDTTKLKLNRTVKSKGPKLTLTDENSRTRKVQISDRTDDIVKYDRSVIEDRRSSQATSVSVSTKCEHKNIVMEFMTGDYCCSDCWRRVSKPPAEYGPVKFYPGSRCPRK